MTKKRSGGGEVFDVSQFDAIVSGLYFEYFNFGWHATYNSLVGGVEHHSPYGLRRNFNFVFFRQIFLVLYEGHIIEFI